MSMDAKNSGKSSEVSKPISLHQAELYLNTFFGGISATCQLKKKPTLSVILGKKNLRFANRLMKGNVNIPPGLNSFLDIKCSQ